MKHLVGLLLVMASVLSGCTTIETVVAANEAVSKVSDSKELDTLCKIEPLAYQGFQLIKSRTTINPTYVLRVDQAHAAVRQVCVDRPSNLVEALDTATAAYTQILNTQEAVVEAVEAGN